MTINITAAHSIARIPITRNLTTLFRIRRTTTRPTNIPAIRSINMKTTEHATNPPPLSELAAILTPALTANYTTASVTVSPCPDLRHPPYHLTSPGLSGRESIADIGGQPNLFPDPRLDRKWSMVDCARAMDLPSQGGMIIGAGAGPFWQVGCNSELAPNFSWEGSFGDVRNGTHLARIDKGSVMAVCERCESTDCALMMNLYGSAGKQGEVLKVVAKGRKGKEKSFTECIRRALRAHYGEDRMVSLGGVFVVRSGKTNYHVMPDFPTKPPGKEHTFTTAKELNDWLTYHDFDSSGQSPIVCLSVLHSADPGKELGLRMEHTHCFTTDGSQRGGHYHGDLDESAEEVEYEGYFNTAKVVYRIDKPEVRKMPCNCCG